MKKTTENEAESNIDIQRLHDKYKEYSKMKKEPKSTEDKVMEFFSTVLASTLYSYGFYIIVAITGGISWYLGADFDLIGISMIVFFVVSCIISIYVSKVIDKRKDKLV